jgi:hypothetical protein
MIALLTWGQQLCQIAPQDSDIYDIRWQVTRRQPVCVEHRGCRHFGINGFALADVDEKCSAGVR